MTSIVHSLTFNSEFTAKRVDIGNDTIGFSTFHKLNVGDKVQYDAQRWNSYRWSLYNAFYFVSTVDTSTIKLHRLIEMQSGINTVDIGGFGTGVQQIIRWWSKIYCF